jgi:hypothetical protein
VRSTEASIERRVAHCRRLLEPIAAKKIAPDDYGIHATTAFMPLADEVWVSVPRLKVALGRPLGRGVCAHLDVVDLLHRTPGLGAIHDELLLEAPEGARAEVTAAILQDDAGGAPRGVPGGAREGAESPGQGEGLLGHGPRRSELLCSHLSSELLERGPLRPQDLVNDPAYLSAVAKGWPLSAPTITT